MYSLCKFSPHKDWMWISWKQWNQAYFYNSNMKWTENDMLLASEHKKNVAFFIQVVNVFASFPVDIDEFMDTFKWIHWLINTQTGCFFVTYMSEEPKIEAITNRSRKIGLFRVIFSNKGMPLCVSLLENAADALSCK